MKEVFEIKDQKSIYQVLESSEYGTLAICAEDRPYSLPLNFATIGDTVYFHGAKTGRKMDILKQNSFASFSVVQPYAMIQSYFSTDDDLACPATQFFKSVIIDGKIAFVQDYDEKVEALWALMRKLQPEGRYRALDDAAYQKMIKATTVYKLIPKSIKAKYKFGQHLTQKRFEKIISHLETRGKVLDQETISMMKKHRKNDAI